MKIHLPGLPHTLPNKSYDWCAYTAKIRRLALMLNDEKIAYQLYWPDIADVVDPATNEVFSDWEPSSPRWTAWNDECIKRIKTYLEPDDLIGVIAGRCQAAVADAFFEHKVVEWGIGYVGVLERSFKVYESYTHRSYVQGWRQDDEGWLRDTVIPNAFDPRDLAFMSFHDSYLLYMGRKTSRKGVQIAIDTARATDKHLIIAGQGDIEEFDTTGLDFTDYGVVTGEQKALFIARAQAVMVPSLYLEPFGGVAVEAMMSGTPAITTDHGAFTETVTQGVTGFRCTTPTEFIEAVESTEHMNRTRVSELTTARYSTAAIAPRYGAYFRRVMED